MIKKIKNENANSTLEKSRNYEKVQEMLSDSVESSHLSLNSKGEAKAKWYRHGYGVNKWKSGAVYEGEWLNNKTHGKGTFWHSGGDIYIGEFDNN